MCVKPWKGAIKKPTAGGFLNLNTAPPDQSYEIEFVHGYKNDMTRHNCLYNLLRLASVYSGKFRHNFGSPNSNSEIFWGGEERLGKIKPPVGFYGHSNDVVCLAMSDDRKKVATGQVGV